MEKNTAWSQSSHGVLYHQLVVTFLFWIFIQLQGKNGLQVMQMISIHSPTTPRVNLHHLIAVLFFLVLLCPLKRVEASLSPRCARKVQVFLFQSIFKWSRDHAHDPCPFSHRQTYQAPPFDCCIVFYSLFVPWEGWGVGWWGNFYLFHSINCNWGEGTISAAIRPSVSKLCPPL